MTPRLSRRALLGGAAGLAGAAAVGTVAAAGAQEPAETAANPSPRGFHGPTQTGVATPARAQSLLASFQVLADDRAAVVGTLRDLTAECRRLVDAVPAARQDPALPPCTTGLLDPDERVDVTVAVGASLFDRRYGLAARRPAELTEMGILANDDLDPDWTHGDLLLTVAADRPDAVLHALRQLMRASRATLSLRWVLDGYSRPDPPGTTGRTHNRNLLGFKDGTANLHVGSADDMSDVWDDAGGSYQAVRLIRLRVERWDRTALAEQEQVIGRAKASGAPLGRAREEDDPDYGSDPHGLRIPKDAHIRLARPRTPGTESQRMLRRGFSFQKGFDGAGQLDQGLAFVSYQSSLSTFLAVQERLRGERLEEYALPFGGGFFYVLPGVRDEADFLGRSLLA